MNDEDYSRGAYPGHVSRDRSHGSMDQHDHNEALMSIDSNKDGIISSDEMAREKRLLEIYQITEKAETQRKMAWIALISMLLMTIVLFTPIMSDSRVNVLGDILPLFYISNASIVGFYFGAQAYMGKGVGTSRGK